MNRRNTLVLLTAAIGLSPGASRGATDAGSRSQRTSGQPSESTGNEPRSALPRLDLSMLGPSQRVRSIRHLQGSYRVATVDGNSFDFLESDLRFKVDSSAAGPLRRRPVILRAGSVGDRAWVCFAAPDEISAFIET